MTNISSYGSLGASIILNTGIKNIEQKQTDIAWQSSQGTVSSSIDGLGSTAAASINLTAQLSGLNAYQSNISNVQSRLKMNANALTQLTTLSQNTSSDLITLTNTSGTGVSFDTTANTAENSLSSLANILNTNDGNGYIFGGKDTTTKPVSTTNNLMDTPLGKAIQSLVSNMTSDNAGDIIKQATKLASDNSLSIFSDSLSKSATDATKQQNIVSIGSSGQTTTNGIVATQGGAASDTSTGSPIRDQVRDLMITASLKGMNSQTPGFSTLISDLRQATQNTSNELIDMNGSVGIQQNSLSRQQSLYSVLTTMTQSQLSNNLDVDAASVATQSNDLQNQLKASFMLIADGKSMTLANYI